MRHFVAKDFEYIVYKLYDFLFHFIAIKNGYYIMERKLSCIRV